PSTEPYPFPQFGFCSTKLHADIRVLQLGSWVSDVESESDERGSGKWGERLLWRAMNTGMHYAEHMSCRRPNDSVEVLLSDMECEGGEGGKRCDEAGKYKYALDVYGNGWSSQFKRLTTANALTFKSTIYPKWSTASPPWVHYVLIQNAYSDLYDVLVSFRGYLAGRWAHEELVAKIAREGVEWSLTSWRKEDFLFRCVHVLYRGCGGM
ncbi:hypothetical protein K503DRAFT_700396, partial [Rhizopogon vinicolor AM-OR11-026]